MAETAAASRIGRRGSESSGASDWMPNVDEATRWVTFELDDRISPVACPPTLAAAERSLLDAWAGPLLVTGGPGSGKTTLAVQAAVRVLRSTAVPPPVVLTWSRQAASTMRNRISAVLGAAVSRPNVTTVHSLAQQLLLRFGDSPKQRLLTAPEQEFRVRELLAGRGPRAWPTDLGRAFGTRQFARQVRAVLARARQLGLDPQDVVRMGSRAGQAEWVAVGEFFSEYLDVMDQEGALDYAELVHRARILLTEPVVHQTLGEEIGAVVIDEYGELDPSQIGLVRALVRPGMSILVTGDPLQTVTGFRGAHPRALLEFPTLFPTQDGSPAPVHRLVTSHRLGGPLAVAVGRVAERLPQSGGKAGSVGHDGPSLPGTTVDVVTWPDEAGQADGIAAELLRAHLVEGLEYGDMAVLVRSGRRHLGGLIRALTAAGVPVEVAGDEVPLAEALSVRPLLLALETLTRGRIEPDEALRLATSPLGGFDATGLRGLRRQWRAVHDSAGGRSTADVLASALTRPELVAALPPSAERDRLARLGKLLTRAREVMEAGGPVDQVLWQLWNATDWSRRLEQDSLRGGDPGRRADRDLDALCALFETAAQADRRGGAAGLRRFLAEVTAEQIPADRSREARLHGRGVSLMTVHRAKGQEWELVVVAGVQEGVWPAARRAAGLLEPERMLSGGLIGGTDHREWLAAERRLFYVACSRPRRRLVVSACSGTEGEADQPSRFLAELGVSIRRGGPSSRPFTMAALVAELRRAGEDSHLSLEARQAAAVRLARLADATDDVGTPVAPSADPTAWWGMRELSSSPRPFHERVRLSPSQVTSLLTCPRRYFLQRPAQAEGVPGMAAGLGSIIHTLVQHAFLDGLTSNELAGHLDRIWSTLPFEASWFSQVERVEAELALERFLAWQESSVSHIPLGVEVPFEVDVDLEGTLVTLAGVVDRLELAPEGGLRVVDFKTGRSLPTRAQVAGMEQLGVYQLVVEQGGFDGLAPGVRTSAGAHVVYLRHGEGAAEVPRRFDQAPLTLQPYLGDDPGERAYPTWVHQRVAAAARIVADGRFPAAAGSHCRSCSFADSCPASARGRQVVQ